MSGKFVVVLSCDDCTGTDPQGCGDGNPWLLEDETGPLVFATREEADDAGYDEADSPWTHKVVEQ